MEEEVVAADAAAAARLRASSSSSLSSTLTSIFVGFRLSISVSPSDFGKRASLIQMWNTKNKNAATENIKQLKCFLLK